MTFECHEEVSRILSVGVPLSILSASILGSGHCAAMCGGLATAMSPTRSATLGYHGGRIVAYTFAGGAAGYLGKSFLLARHASAVSIVGTLLFVAFLMVMGLQVWRGQTPHFSSPFLSSLFGFLMRKIGAYSSRNFFYYFVAGLLTLLLPCGWLYGFVVGASATGQPIAGAIFMFLFALGTIPALITATVGFRTGLGKFSNPRWAGAIFIGLGFLTLFLRLA